MRWFWQPCDKIHYSQEAEEKINSLQYALDYAERRYDDAKRYRDWYEEVIDDLTEKKKEIVDLREHVSTLRDLLWSAELELRELKGLDVPIKSAVKEKWIEENPHDWDVSFE